MASRADIHLLLDYAEIQIFPSQNRYEVRICKEGNSENLEDGVLELLSPHLPLVNELCSKGSNATCKLLPPGNMNDVTWFTKATLSRFLQIVRSSDVVHTTSSVKDELLQLEEARKFHLSLYGQSNTEKASFDTSKNELLRALELRLTALRTELTDAFCKVASSVCSSKEITNLAKFSEHFGGVDLRDNLRKLSQLNNESAGDGKNKIKRPVMSDSRIDENIVEGDAQTLKPTPSGTPVKYGVSPAKAAQVERHSPTESEKSSESSDEDRPSAERSRTLIRSASPRRSASPMRRVQIGRGGSRRAAALTIKSIGYIPARDKSFPYRDGAGNSSEEEQSEQPNKKHETHVRRMSVQDAINLFERKQKDHTEDNPQLRKSMSSLSVTANKAVLRRWSSGMGESSAQCEPEPEDNIAAAPCDEANYESNRNSGDDKSVLEAVPSSHKTIEIPEDNTKSERYERSSSDPIDIEEDTSTVKEDDDAKKAAATTEWNRLKEAELNQMLIQMMETKPAKFTKSQPNRKLSLPSGQRGGFYDHYKEKRDEKLRGENTKKKAEKEAQFKAMQKILDERKAEMASKKVNGVEKKSAVRKSQKPLNNSPQPLNPKKETPKASVPKKVSPRTSPLPPTRKSWPSNPPARAAAISPAKTPVGNSSANTTPTRRKTQQTQSLPRIAPKMERPQQPQKSVKEPLVESVKNLKTTKSVNEKPSLAPKKSSTTTKVKKVLAEECSDVVSAKPSLYSKVTKKSSVVPVEPKPFLRKGSRATPSVNKKNSYQSEEPQKNSEDPIEVRETEVFPIVAEQVDATSVPNLDANIDSEDPINSHREFSMTENFESVHAEDNVEAKKSTEDSSMEIQVEEEIFISPSAWVEIEEHEHHGVPSIDDRSSQHASSANTAATGSASPRIRHSLSQMLLEESNEPDIVEWGNAENPPAIMYHKDAPKGLKRLLKFARKSNKGDVNNNSGFSSPSVFSEGEDDSDGFMKKGALNVKNQKTSLSESYDAREHYSAQSGIGKYNARSNFQKLQDSSELASVSTTKATRSFFSLSAFRGGAK